jgi:hypothetical protein
VLRRYSSCQSRLRSLLYDKLGSDLSDSGVREGQLNGPKIVASGGAYQSQDNARSTSSRSPGASGGLPQPPRCYQAPDSNGSNQSRAGGEPRNAPCLLAHGEGHHDPSGAGGVGLGGHKPARTRFGDKLPRGQWLFGTESLENASLLQSLPGGRGIRGPGSRTATSCGRNTLGTPRHTAGATQGPP